MSHVSHTSRDGPEVIAAAAGHLQAMACTVAAVQDLAPTLRAFAGVRERPRAAAAAEKTIADLDAFLQSFGEFLGECEGGSEPRGNAGD